MSNPASAGRSGRESRWWAALVAAVAALGVVTGIAGCVAAWQRRRPMTGASASGNQLICTAKDALQAAPQGLSPSGANADENHAAHVLDLNAAIARRPVRAVSVTAIIAVVVTGAVVVLATAESPRDSIVDMFRVAGSPTDQLPAQSIPAAESGEACRNCGNRAGQQFTLDFGEPWVVTQVGFRPLELVSGRRVTKLRWELYDPERTVFSQYEDAADGHDISLARLGGDGYRTWRITAVVEETVPAPDAELATSSSRSPLVAYGNRAEDSTAGTTTA